MDPAFIVYLLIGGMVASGGVLGAFWVRALTLMRRQVLDSSEALQRITSKVDDLQIQMDSLSRDNLEIREQLDQAQRLLDRGDESGSTEPRKHT